MQGVQRFPRRSWSCGRLWLAHWRWQGATISWEHSLLGLACALWPAHSHYSTTETLLHEIKASTDIRLVRKNYWIKDEDADHKQKNTATLIQYFWEKTAVHHVCHHLTFPGSCRISGPYWPQATYLPQLLDKLCVLSHTQRQNCAKYHIQGVSANTFGNS